MSRYPPPEYRGPRDRSRSPPRFPDRRPSAASIFDSRPPGPPRNGSDAPRGPRSQQFDASRPSFAGGSVGAGSAPRPSYASLRDAPPLGSGDRGRPFRERDYERRERLPSPRERSPPRVFKDPRDYPPRDLDINRARRASGDGPPSAGSNLSNNPPLAAPPLRGAFGRGRGRGDFGAFRGGRGGRREFDERELFRRERSPPPPQRWSRDLSREGREPERREERRPLERREDERRPDWIDREREVDRTRRDQPPARPEARPSNDLLTSGAQPPPGPQTLQIDPGRLALLEQAGADVSLVRRPSALQHTQPTREARRDVPDTPSYLNSRAETMANRYNHRGSSPPTQAPAVPAFNFSFAPSAPSASAASNAPPMHAARLAQNARASATSAQEVGTELPDMSVHERLDPPINAPTAPKAAPPAPKADLAEPPPSAPKALRALDVDAAQGFGARLQGVRSLENINLPAPSAHAHSARRPDPVPRPSPNAPMLLSPAQPPPALPTLIQPVSPNAQNTRFGELAAPTGPRATRMSPAQASVSPRPPFASPRSDTGGFQGFPGFPRGQTPMPSAPSGPRHRSFSVSPKVTSSTVPTAPKGIRGTSIAPRAGERGLPRPGQATDRLGAPPPPPPWAPPSAPRGQQWNQWRRQGAPMYAEKNVPAKRDFAGEQKEHQPETLLRRNTTLTDPRFTEPAITTKAEEEQAAPPDHSVAVERQDGDQMDVDARENEQPKQSQVSGHSAAQSFFGKPVETTEDEPGMSEAPGEPFSSSEDDEADLEQDLALFNAKYERQKRALESKLADLGARELRATTPLESIARLTRMSPKDLQRVQEQQEMEVDEAPQVVDNSLLVPPATHSSGSDEGPDLLTPRGEEDTGVEIRSADDNPDTIRRARRPSPEIITLPYLVKEAQPFDESEDLQSNIQRQQDTKAAVLAALQEEAEEETAADEDNNNGFRDLFRKWREECEEHEREREELEKLERQQSAEPGPELDAPSLPAINPVMEGRRLHKFSSEYEIEQVIKQSEETARIEQERQDRESRKLQADMEKEAKIPNQQREGTFKRGVFIDTNRYRDPDKLTMAFSYEPQPDTFTEDEQRIFIAAFKETPKKWGEIASLLPNRTYKDCIHHYYTNKWDGRFRDNRTRKLKAGGRRGRGGKAPPRGRGSALMADLGRAEEVLAVPSVSDSGRPKRAAAPTTFGERESDAKAAMIGPSPAKKLGLGSKQDTIGEGGSEKPMKRRKGAGEKPGRKPKAQQPLAALAAAPAASPNKQSLPESHGKEEMARAQQSLEDAALLAGLQSAHNNMLMGDGQLIYHQEGFAPQMLRDDELARSKALVGQTPSSKTSASSYWSVPEQTDFAKYIAHFGTDFAAIAAHMGTKTQTMIKNHYQRQIDSGNRPELHTHAVEADRRREAGEDMGPPPTPTPIVKRKYDAPQPTAPRTLAPHGEAMDIDEAPPPQRVPPPKHASPPQFQTQPRFTPSAQATPIPAHRVVPSPVPSTASPAISQAQPVAPARPMQHPLGQRLTFLSDSRPESRPGLQATSSFRLGQETPPRSQPQQQNPVPDHYIRNLMQEQERALRMQEQQERMDPLHRPSSMSSVQRGSAQGSPATQPLQPPPERKLPVEERAPSPPRSNFVQSPFSRPPFGQQMFGPLTGTPLPSSLMARAGFNPSPPKKEEARPSSVPALPPVPPPVTAAAPPEPPKRSNLMSILNADADEPKPPKRESLPTPLPRVASPAPPGFQSIPTPAPQPNAPQPRRETFGQPSMPQSQFHRSSFSQQGQTPVPPAQAVKREPSVASTPLAQPPPRQDWAAHVLAPPPQPSQSAQPTLERDTRPYFSHRTAALGVLNQPNRANPSPPPHTIIGHSRTPSLTTAPTQPPPRDQHSVLPGQQPQHGQHGPVQPLHSNPYAQPSAGTPFSQPPSQQVQNNARHAHNSSLGGGFPAMHHRAPSREDNIRRQHEEQVRRDRDEQGWRRMQQEQEMRDRMQDRELRDIDRQREAAFYAQQRQQQQQQQEHERQQQQQQHGFPRGPLPPQPLQPPTFNGAAFGQPRGSVGLRDQALRETEAAMRQEEVMRENEQRHAQHGDRMRFEAAMREQQQIEEFRRRQQQQQEDALFQRRTPLGNGFGHPPPAQPRR